MWFIGAPRTWTVLHKYKHWTDFALNNGRIQLSILSGANDWFWISTILNVARIVSKNSFHIKVLLGQQMNAVHFYCKWLLGDLNIISLWLIQLFISNALQLLFFYYWIGSLYEYILIWWPINRIYFCLKSVFLYIDILIVNLLRLYSSVIYGGTCRNLKRLFI